jgi:urea transport system substrate-binding protein
MIKVTHCKDGITRRGALGTLAAAAAAVAMPYTIREPWAATPIKVGVISPLTGAWTVYGKAHFSGFELAVEEINKAGGVLGRPMEIVVGDSKTELCGRP